MKSNKTPRSTVREDPEVVWLSETERTRTYKDGWFVREIFDRPTNVEDYKHLMRMIHDLAETFGPNFGEGILTDTGKEQTDDAAA